MPWLLFKLRVCERFGWTYDEFDETDASELLKSLKLDDQERKLRKGMNTSASNSDE